MANATKKKAETKVGLKEANNYKAKADHFPAEDWAQDKVNTEKTLTPKLNHFPPAPC